MKFSLTCMASEMARALSLCTSVTDHGIKVPMLKATRIEVGKQGADFVATNTDHAVRVTVAAEGKGIIHADTLALSLKASALRPAQPVTLTADDEGKFISMVQGKTRWRVPIILGDGYPVAFTQAVKGETVTLPAAPLFEAMSIVAVAMVPSIVQVNGQGLLLDMGEDQFRAVVAARSGMFVVAIDAPPLPLNIIVPTDAARAIRDVFKGADEVNVLATPNALDIESDGVLYRTKLIEGIYPDWRRARDTQSIEVDKSCIVVRQEFLDALGRTTAIAEDKSNEGAYIGIRVTLADGECIFAAANRTGEQGTDACPMEGDAGTFAASAHHLAAALGTLGTIERLSIAFSDNPERPIIIRPEPSGPRDDYRIVMPMRI